MDDKLKFNAMEVLHKRASTDRLEVLCFEGETIFDKDELITKYNYQKRWCERSREYSGVKTGRELFVSMISNDDYKVVVWILFINRAFYVNNSLAFVPQILFEDNVFTFELFLRANRVGHIFEKLYVRRVREGSITTSQFTFERVYGFFVCIAKCKEILEDSCLSEKEKSFFYQEIDRLLWCCKNEYKKLSGGEAEKYLLLPITQTKLLKYLIVDICKIEQENLVLKKKIKIVENKHRELFQKYNILDKENRYNIKKLVEIKVGWSFRIGRVITFVPRKIREFLKR